jgi:hypothetical protein
LKSKIKIAKKNNTAVARRGEVADGVAGQAVSGRVTDVEQLQRENNILCAKVANQRLDLARRQEAQARAAQTGSAILQSFMREREDLISRLMLVDGRLQALGVKPLMTAFDLVKEPVR